MVTNKLGLTTSNCPFLGTDEEGDGNICLAHPESPTPITSRQVKSFCLTSRPFRCTRFNHADPELKRKYLRQLARGLSPNAADDAAEKAETFSTSSSVRGPREEFHSRLPKRSRVEPASARRYRESSAAKREWEDATGGHEASRHGPETMGPQSEMAGLEIENVPTVAPSEGRAVFPELAPPVEDGYGSDDTQDPETAGAEPEERDAPIPIPVITSPMSGASVPAQDLVVSGTGAAGLTVQLLHWGVIVAVTTVRADGTWSIPFPVVGAGDHIFVARASDGVGRSSGQSPLLSVTVPAPQPAEHAGSEPEDSASRDGGTAHRSPGFGERWMSPGGMERMRRVGTVLLCGLAVTAVVVVTLVLRPEMSWFPPSAAGPASHRALVQTHDPRSPAVTGIRRPTPGSTPQRGSAQVLAAEASRTGSRRTRRSPASSPVQGYSAAHFPALSARAGTVLLTLSNQTGSALEVAVRFPTVRGPGPLHVDLPAHSSGELNLSAETPQHAGGALSLSSAGPFLAQRWVVGGPRTLIAGATPDFGASPQVRPAKSTLAARLATVLARAARLDGFSGTALIRRRGKIALEQGYGFSNGHVPIQPSTAFPIRGLTAMFTTLAILELQDRHQLSVTDPMCRYLAGCPASFRRITIEQLLTNTSGLPRPQIDVTKPFGEAELMAAFGASTPVFRPGTHWKASDTGYVLLGFIIEKVSHVPYQRFIHDHILAPLGMVESGFVLDSRHPTLALGFHGSTVVPRLARPGYAPAWGMYSTVTDLARFDRALDHHTLLSSGATSMMLDRHVRFPANGGYGYGWTIGTFHGQRFATTNAGGSPGYVGVNLRLLGDHSEIIVLSNQDRTSLLPLVTDLGNQLLTKP